NDAETTRELTVDKNRDAIDKKNDERGCARVLPFAVQHRDEEHRQNKPADSKTVCPVHAGMAEVSSLNTGRFQIGTTFFSSSMIHWLAPKAPPRCPLLTRTTTDGSPAATNPTRCRRTTSRRPNFAAAVSATIRI